MKITFSISFIFFISFINIYGQIDDPQWFIINNKVNLPNNPTHNLPVGDYFGIYKQMTADTTYEKRAKNDILIIFKDGSFFNSRYKYQNQKAILVDPIEHLMLGDTTKPNYYIQIPDDKTVEYLYLTNVYEGSEDPDSISARSLNPLLNSIPNLFNIIPSDSMDIQPEGANFNHDLVPNSDVVLSINLHSFILETAKDSSCLYSLDFNEILLDNQEYPGDIVSPKNFNGNFSIYPSVDNYQLQQNRIKFYTSEQFINIGFEVNENLNHIISPIPDDKLKGRFILNSNCIDSTVIIDEYIRSSHDPNFVKVDSVGEINGKKYVHFHIQFQNTGTNVVDSFKVIISKSSIFDFQNLEIKSWFGGTNAGSSLLYDTTDSQIIFNFPDYINNGSDNVYLAAPGESTYPHTIGYVKYCVPLFDRYNYIDLKTHRPLIPEQVHTTFNQDTYAIQQRIDPQLLIIEKEYFNCCLCRYLPRNCRFQWINRFYDFFGCRVVNTGININNQRFERKVRQCDCDPNTPNP